MLYICDPSYKLWDNWNSGERKGAVEPVKISELQYFAHMMRGENYHIRQLMIRGKIQIR